MGTGDYLLCGWRVRSDLVLPELVSWNGPEAFPPDITITEGAVPEHLEDAIIPGRYLMVGADGSVLLHIPNLVRIMVRQGREITVEILRWEEAPGWRLYLLGAAFGYLCHQRGVFPLHAASLRIGGRTIAITGPTGIGKSTLALALVQRGHALLSDDLTVLRCTNGIDVLPAFPRLKLWREALDNLSVDIAGLERVRDGLEKYDLRLHMDFDPAPVRLDAILTFGEGPELALCPLSPAAAVPLLYGNVGRPKVAVQLRGRAVLFDEAAAIARSVPVFRLERPKRFDALAATAALIEAQFGG